MKMNIKSLMVCCSMFFFIFLTPQTSCESTTNETPISLNSKFSFPKNRKSGGISKRIIGGGIAAAHEYPYQVALYVYVGTTLYFCGGSLVADQWVLTAAHCVDSATHILVILGAQDLSTTDPNELVYNSSTFILHEGWDEAILQNDVALIKLPKKITLNEYIRTIELASGSDSYDGVLGRVLGWGITILGSLSSVLRYVDVTVITNENCNTYQDYNGYIVSSHICTSGEGIVGSCNGDSGGPLVVNGIQIGIVSFGYSDCAASMPSVYTRVTEYSDWVRENIETSDSETTTESADGRGVKNRLEIGYLILAGLSFLYSIWL